MFLRRRPLLVAPAVVLSWVLVLPVVSTTQGVALAIVSGTMLGFFTIEAWIAGRREVGERWLFVSLLVTALALLVAAAGTGAIASPYVPLLFAPTVTAFAAFGRGRRSAVAFAVVVLGVLALALLPEGTPFAALPEPVRDVMTVCTVILGAALLRVSVAGLSDAHGDAGRDLDRLRADLLEGMATRATEVESIGAKVAHEIRNPLTAIRGLVDLLAKDATEPRAVARFDVVRGEITRVEGILRDYLGFARPLAALRREPVAIAGLLARIVDILDARAHGAGVGLERRVEVADAFEISADPSRLTEALLNLVGNAIEACDRGGTVTLALRGVRDGVELAILDDGRGMSPGLLARIGTPYVSERPGGTGLGVVLARQVIEQHGGTLGYDSVQGQGTRVTVWLPCTAVPG
ncbi:MAG: sensor histidine kinase [Myxococcales bacterium]|nr:sensor histidine kinase [Myxococcales bacterium]